MKHSQCLWLFAIILIANACHKDANKPTNFPDTTYQSLAPYNSSGQPDNLLKDTISPAMVSSIGQTLINGENLTISHPELFTGVNPADIPITQSSNVFVTFVWQDAGLSNTLAFYTYPTGQPPITSKDVKSITYIFPNGGKKSTLASGDKMLLGKFNPGTTIGFVVLQNAWDTSKSFLNSDVLHLCSTDALNPETNPTLKRHAILLNYFTDKKIIGFEDTNRESPACDNDFEDIVFYCTIQAQP